MVRIARTVDSLKSASQVVHYELAMLGNTLHEMLKSNTQIDSPPQEQILSNALLHAFLIAARNLCDFLYRCEPWDNDIIAEDFFDDAEEWKRLRPDALPEFSNGSFVKMISRRLLHLTYDRAEGTKPTWSSFRIAWEIAKSFEVFIDKVRPARLCEELIADATAFVQSLRRIRDEYESADDVDSVPLLMLWEEANFWTRPRPV